VEWGKTKKALIDILLNVFKYLIFSNNISNKKKKRQTVYVIKYVQFVNKKKMFTE